MGFLLKVGAIIAFSSVFLTGSANAAKRFDTNKSAPVGNDISWPQCNKAYPANQAFGIVGVTGGLANTTNGCLASQLAWAAGSNGLTSQPKIQLYVNTANPGGLNTPSWPKSNIDPANNIAPNPYGTCDGRDTVECAWQYGWNRAVEDVRDRLAPAAAQANLSSNPADYAWWLDVEAENTWKAGSAAALQSNRADLEGMTAYLQSVGAKVGAYSTNTQWKQIIGQTSPGSSLYELPSWLAGARNLSGAKSNCSSKPLNGGGKVLLTQYVSGSFDYDYSCV